MDASKLVHLYTHPTASSGPNTQLVQPGNYTISPGLEGISEKGLDPEKTSDQTSRENTQRVKSQQQIPAE